MTSGSSAAPLLYPPLRPSVRLRRIRRRPRIVRPRRPCPQNANISPSLRSLSFSCLSLPRSHVVLGIVIVMPKSTSPRRAVPSESASGKLHAEISLQNIRGKRRRASSAEGGGRMRCGANKIPFAAQVKAEGGTNCARGGREEVSGIFAIDRPSCMVCCPTLTRDAGHTCYVLTLP